METMITLSFASVLILSLIADSKKEERLMNVRDFLMVVLSLGFFLSVGQDSNPVLIWVVSGYLTLIFILSLLNNLNIILKTLLPLLALPIFLLVEKPMVYGEYSISFGAISVLSFIALGFLVPYIVDLKTKIISKIFGQEQKELAVAIGPVLLGVLLFSASFFHSIAGGFLVSLGLWSNVLLNKGQGKNLALFSLGILLVHPFLSIGKIDVVDLTLGKSIEGLLFGAFAVLFVGRMLKAKKLTTFAPLLGTILTMLLMAFILILGTQKADFGGVDSFIAALYGMSILFLANDRHEWKSTVFMSVVLVGLVVAPLTLGEEQTNELVANQEVKNETSKVVEEAIDPFAQTGASLADIAGDYTIDEKNLEFVFELGPKGGRTKGKFKAIKGSVSVKEEVEKSVFDVQLNVADLTTMNKFRDESLMGAEYFNVAKYPSITFKSKKLVKKDDGYELQGEFTMMGIKKAQNVLIELVSSKEGGVPSLIGKGAVDRTLFGMKPDPKEGNVVDFQFKIQLNSKN